MTSTIQHRLSAVASAKAEATNNEYLLTSQPVILKVATMAKKLYIIDGHAHIYAAYYAPMRPLTGPSGEPTVATSKNLSPHVLGRDSAPQFIGAQLKQESVKITCLKAKKMWTKAKPKIWFVVLIFLLSMGCKIPAKKADAPGANKRPAFPNPISSNEYEFGVIRSMARSAWSKKEFFFLVRNPVHFKRVILYKNNRLVFDGSGGIRNGGLCWWHSRLTRSATYLTVYQPDLPKPTEE